MAKKSGIFCDAGFSLLEAVMLTSLLGVGSTVLLQKTNLSVQKHYSLKTRADFADLSQRLENETNCLRSMAPYAGNLTSICGAAAPALPVPPPLSLLSKNGGSIISINQKLGRYRINAYCENYTEAGVAKRGIAVYATIPDPTKPGKFLKESLTGKVFDRNNPASRILAANEGLCKEVLNTTPYNCGIGGLVSEVKADGSVVCASNATVCNQLGGAWNSAKGRCLLKFVAGSCAADESQIGYDLDGKPICEKPGKNLSFYNVKKVGGNPGGGTSKITVCCKGGDPMLACSGARQEDVLDTCDEEVCGYVGAVISGNCCTAGADTDKGTKSVADGLCLEK